MPRRKGMGDCRTSRSSLGRRVMRVFLYLKGYRRDTRAWHTGVREAREEETTHTCRSKSRAMSVVRRCWGGRQVRRRVSPGASPRQESLRLGAGREKLRGMGPTLACTLTRPEGGRGMSCSTFPITDSSGSVSVGWEEFAMR
jgi:hypothetical protein